MNNRLGGGGTIIINLCNFGYKPCLAKGDFSFPLWIHVRECPAISNELQGVTTVDDVLQVLDVDDPLWQGFTAQVGDPGHHVRILAALPRAVVIQGCVQGTLPTGEKTAMQATHVGLVWRTCRKVVHLWAGLPEGDFTDIDPWANDPADKMKEIQQVASTQGATTVKERILKMATVVDQADDSELLLATRTELDKWANCYVAVMGAPPLEEEEPNEAQLSALHRRVNVLKQPPYADFGVWLPFARRTQKARKFRAFMPVGDGTYMVKEMPGPQNMIQWLSSWKVCKVALIMLDVASLASLQLYEKTVERLVMQWPKCWHLIVMADHKGRAERLEKIRMRFMMDEDANRTVPSDWSRDKPWTSCFRALSLDNEYWDEQVRYPAAAWLASGGRGVALAPAEQVALIPFTGGYGSLGSGERGPGRTQAQTGQQRQKIGQGEEIEIGERRAGQAAEAQPWWTSCRSIQVKRQREKQGPSRGPDLLFLCKWHKALWNHRAWCPMCSSAEKSA